MSSIAIDPAVGQAVTGPVSTPTTGATEKLGNLLDYVDEFTGGCVRSRVRRQVLDLAAALGDKVSALAAAKSDLTDSLLGAVRENEALQSEVARLQGIVADLREDLAIADSRFAAQQQSLIEDNETIRALTAIDPNYLRKAVALIRRIAKNGEQRRASDPLCGMLLSADMREGARQIEELAIAIERANEGVQAR